MYNSTYELKCEKRVERFAFLTSGKTPNHFPNPHKNRKIKDASQNNQ